VSEAQFSPTPFDLVHEFQQAVRLYQQGNRDDALAACNAILTQDKAHCDALHLLGVIYHQRGRHYEAIACLDAALKVRPASLPILSGLGLVYVKVGRFADAVANYDRLLAIDPGSLEALHNRANALMELGRYGDALAGYDKVLSFQPNVADTHYNRGNALRALKRPMEALAGYDKALSLRPDDAKALRNRASLLIEVGRLAQALEDFDKLLTLSPNDAEAQSNRNHLLRQLDQGQKTSLTQTGVAPPLMPFSYTNAYQQSVQLAVKKVDTASANGSAAEQSSDVSRDFKEALLLSQQGKTDEAIARCKAVLKEKPLHFDALHLLGFLFYQPGHNLDAIDCLSTAIKQQPDDVETLSVLAMLHFKQHQHAELLTTCNRILALQLQNVDALINRGCALMDLRRQGEALKSFNKAAGLAPDNAKIFNNQGNALRELDQFEDALVSFHNALTLQPDYVDAWSNQGHVFLGLKRHSEALQSYEKTLVPKPNYVDALNGVGVALAGLGRYDEALTCYDKALAIEPDYDGLFANKATALTETGKIDAARELIKTAIKLTPEKPYLYYKLVESTRLGADDPYLEAMRSLCANVRSFSTDDRIYLHFGLGKGFSDTRDPERAFQHWRDGAALKRTQVAYDERETLGYLKRTEAAFTRTVLEAPEGLGDPSSAPIFILGMPRSGSTLVEQILATVPKVHGAGEIDDFAQAISQLPGFHSPEQLSQLSGESLRQLGANYIGRIQAAAPPTADRIVNKMLDNFQFIGLIQMALPNARIIHTRRDPIDTCFSCFTTLFNKTNLPYTYDLAELGRYYRAYEALMEHWRYVLPPGVMLDLQYEDVVADLEGQSRRVLDFCGLEWDPRCLDFHQTERPVHTASVNQVRQPLYKSSVARAQAYQQFLGPLLAELSWSTAV
jgi:tetratricopeptide (TPR) repeat protein